MSVCDPACFLLLGSWTWAPPSLGRKNVLCADCECPQPVEGAGWNPHTKSSQSLSGSHRECSPSLPQPWPHSTSCTGQPLSPCPNLASLRHSGLRGLLLPARARLVTGYREGSGLRDTLPRAKLPSGKEAFLTAALPWPPRPLRVGYLMIISHLTPCPLRARIHPFPAHNSFVRPVDQRGPQTKPDELRGGQHGSPCKLRDRKSPHGMV